MILECNVHVEWEEGRVRDEKGWEEEELGAVFSQSGGRKIDQRWRGEACGARDAIGRSCVPGESSEEKEGSSGRTVVFMGVSQTGTEAEALRV